MIFILEIMHQYELLGPQEKFFFKTFQHHTWKLEEGERLQLVPWVPKMVWPRKSDGWSHLHLKTDFYR